MSDYPTQAKCAYGEHLVFIRATGSIVSHAGDDGRLCEGSERHYGQNSRVSLSGLEGASLTESKEQIWQRAIDAKVDAAILATARECIAMAERIMPGSSEGYQLACADLISQITARWLNTEVKP